LQEIANVCDLLGHVFKSVNSSSKRRQQQS
jgi:hypothetical protein